MFVIPAPLPEEMTKPTLYDVANYGNLLVAHANARRNKASYYGVRRCERNKEKMLHKLEDMLLLGNYRTSEYHNKTIIDSGKERMISKLPYFPDRIVHWAIIYQMESLFIDAFSPRSHAAIPDRGIHSALKQTLELVRNPENRYCLKLDVKKYFQHIDHDTLKEKLSGYTDDENLTALLFEIVDSFPEGIPIGNYTSQYFANIYLTSFDAFLESAGYSHVRYMDDIIVFGKDSHSLHDLIKEIRKYLETELKVSVKENWQIFPVAVRGIDFVGYRIFPFRTLIRKSTFLKMRRKLAKVRKHVETGALSDHDRSVIASYAGWVKYCTPKVRRVLYDKYFAGVLDKIPHEKKFVKNIKEQFK